jgi:dynactin 1
MQQGDAALGAEEMVQQLADSKLTLEEHVKDLEEALADLETLQDMSEQLQGGSQELETDLREEVDLANFSTREVRFLWITYHVLEVWSCCCPCKCRINYRSAY